MFRHNGARATLHNKQKKNREQFFDCTEKGTEKGERRDGMRRDFRMKNVINALNYIIIL